MTGQIWLSEKVFRMDAPTVEGFTVTPLPDEGDRFDRWLATPIGEENPT